MRSVNKKLIEKSLKIKIILIIYKKKTHLQNIPK